MLRPILPLVGYGVGAVAAALALMIVLILKALLRPEFPGQIAIPLFLLAVVFSAWYGGTGPGMFTAVLSYLTLDYFFLPPVYSLDPGWEDIPAAGVYLVTALAVSMREERRRRVEAVVQRSKERMHVARAIQCRLFPLAPPIVAGFDIAGNSHPAEATGGDYFDFIPMRDGKIAIVIGDVSGHGFGAALLMAEIRAYLRALVLTHNNVSEILTLTNALVAEDTDTDTFVTLFFACLDPKNRSMIYAGAGHEGYVFHASGCREILRSTSLPLGLEKDLVVAAAPALHLEPGAVLLLLTDGITEAPPERGERFGIKRTIEIISGDDAKTASEMIDMLFESVRMFSGRVPQEDDMTAIIVKSTGQATPCNDVADVEKRRRESFRSIPLRIDS